jgi:hypothetical protein
MESYEKTIHIIYIKNRKKKITKSSEFFLNYDAIYWFGNKLILKHSIAVSDKNIKETLTYIKQNASN